MSRNKRKGQIGIEALVVLGLVVGLMLIVFFALHQKNVENQRIGDILTAQEQADRLAGVINQGAVTGPGFQKNLTVRQTVGGFNVTSFKVRNVSRVVAVQWTGIGNRQYRVTSSILTSSTQSPSNIESSRITVKNTNGTIIIEER